MSFNEKAPSELPMSRGLLAILVLCTGVSGLRAQKEYGFDNTKPSGQPYLKPEESVRRMKVADGFEVKLFAAEPMVVNPIAMTVDEKGRYNDNHLGKGKRHELDPLWLRVEVVRITVD